MVQKHKPQGIILISIFLGTYRVSQLTYSLYALFVEYYLGSNLAVITDFLWIVSGFWLPILSLVSSGLEQTYNHDLSYLVTHLTILSTGVASIVATFAILKGIRWGWNMTIHFMLFVVLSSVPMIILISRSEHFVNQSFFMILPIISVAIVYYLSKKMSKNISTFFQFPSWRTVSTKPFQV